MEEHSTNQRRAPSCRAEAGYGFVAAEDDLGTPGQHAGQGLAEAVGRIIEGILPEGMPIQAAQGGQEVALLALRAKDDLILVKDGGTGKAVVVLEFSRTHLPELFAAKIKSGHYNLFDVQKGHINSLPIGGRRAGREAVFSALVLQFRGQDRLAPEDLSCAAVEREQDALLAFGQGRGRENPIIPDDWRTVPGAWNNGLPGDVAGGAPLRGGARFQTGSITTRSTPGGPVLRRSARRQACQEEGSCEKETRMFHGVVITSFSEICFLSRLMQPPMVSTPTVAITMPGKTDMAP